MAPGLKSQKLPEVMYSGVPNNRVNTIHDFDLFVYQQDYLKLLLFDIEPSNLVSMLLLGP